MTKKKVTDLRAETNLLKQAIDTIKTGAASLTHSKLAVIIAVLGLLLTSLLSALAVYSSASAKAMVEYELEATRQEIVLMKNEVRLLEVYVQDLEATIKVNEYVTP